MFDKTLGRISTQHHHIRPSQHHISTYVHLNATSSHTSISTQHQHIRPSQHNSSTSVHLNTKLAHPSISTQHLDKNPCRCRFSSLIAIDLLLWPSNRIYDCEGTPTHRRGPIRVPPRAKDAHSCKNASTWAGLKPADTAARAISVRAVGTPGLSWKHSAPKQSTGIALTFPWWNANKASTIASNLH